jgi:hypothetical protein
MRKLYIGLLSLGLLASFTSFASDVFVCRKIVDDVEISITVNSKEPLKMSLTYRMEGQEESEKLGKATFVNSTNTVNNEEEYGHLQYLFNKELEGIKFKHYSHMSQYKTKILSGYRKGVDLRVFHVFNKKGKLLKSIGSASIMSSGWYIPLWIFTCN